VGGRTIEPLLKVKKEIPIPMGNNRNKTISVWPQSLYRVAAISAIVIVAMWSIEVIGAILFGPPPGTAIDWFTLYKNHGFLSIIDNTLLDVIAVIFKIPVFLALFVVLNRSNKSLMLLSISFMLIGIILLIGTNASLAMFHLSRQYAIATTTEQKASLLSTSQTLLDISQSGTAGTMAYILPGVSGLLASIAMLGSKSFNRSTGWLGIIANGLQTSEPPVAFAPSGFYTNMRMGSIMIMLSFLFFVIWYVLISLLSGYKVNRFS
jgi:hypothetical protein